MASALRLACRGGGHAKRLARVGRAVAVGARPEGLGGAVRCLACAVVIALVALWKTLEDAARGVLGALRAGANVRHASL